MKTTVGNFLRDVRLDRSENLRDMAEALGVSSAFLSAVENGKKKMPDSWYGTLSKKYSLDKTRIEELKNAVLESSGVIKLNLSKANTTSRKLAVSFARSFESLNEEESEEILKILSK